MKKITILCLHLGYGGIEVAVTNLANMLVDKYDVNIVSIYNLYDKTMYKLDKNVNVNYLINSDIALRVDSYKKNLIHFHFITLFKELYNDYLKKGKIFKLFSDTFNSLKIIKLKKKLMIDYLKTCDSDLIISTRIEITEILNKNYKGKAKLISWEHSHHHNDQKYINRVIKSLDNIDYFMPVSKKLTDFYKNKIKSNTQVIYGPLCVDYIPEKEAKKTKKNIVAIGRLSKEKGFLDLIDVFNIIISKDNECRLHIIGDGFEKNNIENKINELNLNNYVTLYGYKDKSFIREKLNDMSLYLLTSYEESFGLVILEASSFGIPVIAFDSAEGATEIINNDIDGYLISNRDKNLMAEKSIELLNNKKKLAKFGNEARLKAIKYSYDSVKEQWLKIIDNILK